MKEIFNRNSKLIIAISGLILLGVSALIIFLAVSKSQPGKYPERFQKVLGEGEAGRIIISTQDFYIQYYPSTGVFTVILANPTNKDTVQKNVETYFKGYGIKDVDKLNIDYCTQNPGNLEQQKSVWECDL